jgi:hypothetical protein
MKTFLSIARWTIGAFFCVAGVSALFTPDYGIGIFLIITGILISPVSSTLLRRPRQKPIVLAKISDRTESTDTEINGTQAIIPMPTKQNVPDIIDVQSKQKSGLIASIKGWWFAIKAAQCIERATKQYANPRPSDLSTVQKYLQTCPEKEKEFLRKRIIEKYSKFINSDNVEVSGQQYLDFYLTLFPGHYGKEIIHLVNVNKVEAYLFTKVGDDEALDPSEINDVIAFSKKLSVPEYDSAVKIRESFDYYVINWELDNNIFKGIEADFILTKGEKCIYRSPKCEWFERKTVTSRVGYSGVSYRMKITKGLSYRVGSYNVSSSKEIIKVSKGTGVVNITTKRVIFKSSDNTMTINISAIIDLEPFNDAVTIYKSKGHPMTIESRDAINLYKYLRSATRSGQTLANNKLIS